MPYDLRAAHAPRLTGVALSALATAADNPVTMSVLAPKLLKDSGIAVNALWPRTTIATAAIQNLLGGDAIMSSSSMA